MALTPLLLVSRHSAAQEYPSRPITFIVPFSAGGATDVLGRVIAEKAGEKLGKPLVVVNRIGAGGQIGSEVVARAAPDGYTILLGGISTHVLAPALGMPLNYDAAKDFAAVARTNDIPLLFSASAKLPFTDMKGLIAYLKAGPRFYLSAGVGTTAHVYGAAFAHLVGVNAEPVHFKSMADGMQEFLAGNLAYSPADSGAVLGPMIKDGQVRILAVIAEKRLPQYPDVPTMAETGINPPEFMRHGVWNMIFAPGKTPRDILHTLNRAINAGLSEPDAVKRVESFGFIPVLDSTPESTTAFLERERDNWKRAVETTGVKEAVQKTL
jgi:tripartite-type tricarboxylate transporter receptor subunit TctC